MINTAVVLFLVLHLCGAIWFASRMKTQVESVIAALKIIEVDMRSLLSYDAKIQVLAQRMDDGARDRAQVWVAVETLRRDLQEMYRALSRGVGGSSSS